jgi:hypothetical protein
MPGSRGPRRRSALNSLMCEDIVTVQASLHLAIIPRALDARVNELVHPPERTRYGRMSTR